LGLRELSVVANKGRLREIGLKSQIQEKVLKMKNDLFFKLGMSNNRSKTKP